MGEPKVIRPTWIKKGAVVIDFGIVRNPKTGKNFM